jgi:hypothetical protein
MALKSSALKSSLQLKLKALLFRAGGQPPDDARFADVIFKD